MLNRTLLALAAGALMTAGAAHAQSAQLVEVDDATMLMPWNMSADAVEDAKVITPDGRALGEVETVIGSDRTTPTALVVDFDDATGFSDDRVIPLERFNVDGNRLTLTTSAAEIVGLPTYDD